MINESCREFKSNTNNQIKLNIPKVSVPKYLKIIIPKKKFAPLTKI